MLRAVSPGNIIPPAGPLLIPYRRPWTPRVVPVVELFFQEAGLCRDNGENAYFYGRQGHGYDPKLKGLLGDAYY